MPQAHELEKAMKRLLAVLFAAVLAAGTVSANTEITSHIYGAVISERDTEGDVTLEFDTPIGFEDQFGFYFGSPAEFLDLGMSVSVGMDFFWDSTMKVGAIELSELDDSGMDLYCTVGPAVRFNIGDRHSIFVSPGLGYNMLISTADGYDLIISEVDFNFDIGYRFWLVNITGFHFGFSAGYDISVPLFGTAGFYFDHYDDINRDLTGGSIGKFYLGVAFNFGDKSPDKYREE